MEAVLLELVLVTLGAKGASTSHSFRAELVPYVVGGLIDPLRLVSLLLIEEQLLNWLIVLKVTDTKLLTVECPGRFASSSHRTKDWPFC